MTIAKELNISLKGSLGISEPAVTIDLSSIGTGTAKRQYHQTFTPHPATSYFHIEASQTLSTEIVKVDQKRKQKKNIGWNRESTAKASALG